MISISKLRKAMRDIAAKKGEFTFFGLLRRADAPGTWDLVVSAPWLGKGKLKALGEFTHSQLTRWASSHCESSHAL
jgi:hypothetical protein